MRFPFYPSTPVPVSAALHDSLVNYAGLGPKVILCPHEKIAMNLAHGYAKASGQMMATILHDVVGLLHAPNAIYYNYLDRVPVADAGRRRP